MEKIKELLKSRKFWALVASLASVWASYLSGAIDAQHAVDLTVAAFGAYTVGTGLESIGNQALIQRAVHAAIAQWMVTPGVPVEELPDHK